MYISNISIKNFRSISKASVTLEKGKNVIIGKNNSGKSNILKAIQTIIGNRNFDVEKDIYIKSDTKAVSTEIILEITKEDKSDFDKITHFKVFTESKLPKTWILFDPTSEPQWVTDFRYNRSISSKVEFNNVNKLNLVFSYSEEGRFEKYLFYKKSNEYKICIEDKTFNLVKKVLNFDVVDSFRDPKSFLSLSDYSWYGKLMKKIVDDEFTNKINVHLQSIISESTKYFGEQNKEINLLTKEGAFQDTNLSISVIPDVSKGLYKHVRIDADDGYKSDISEKGSGLQNAVAINLYIYYIKNVVSKQNDSSIFCLEEPEIYLHPHGRRAINNRVEDYLKNPKTQAIITTHSPNFINFADESINIIRVGKNKEQGTYIKQIKNQESNIKFILKNKENLEVFFADLVVLCEGAEKYILEKLAEELGAEGEDLGIGWLDNNNITVAKVDGKTNFKKYTDMLDILDIPYYVLGDLDNLTSKSPLIKEVLKNDKNLEDIKNFYQEFAGISNKKAGDFIAKDSQDKVSLIKKIEEAIKEGSITEDLQNSYNYIKNRSLITKLQDLELTDEVKVKIENVIKKLKTHNIFILSKGELENYDTGKKTGKHSLTEVINFVEEARSENKNLSDYSFDDIEFLELLKAVKTKILTPQTPDA